MDAAGPCCGPYRLQRRLARGSSAEVWLAAGADHAAVALKCLRATDPVARADFAAEQALLRRLCHPAIAPWLAGSAPGDPQPWFALRWIDGMPLDQHATRHNLAPRAVLRLLLPILEALAELHVLGLVHGDLKPAHLPVDAQGRCWLLDFGNARPIGATAPAVPGGTAHPCTPSWAAPEQLRGGALGEATDVHGVGRVLGRLCGWAGGTVVVALDAGDTELEGLVRRCLAVEPVERPRLVELQAVARAGDMAAARPE